MNFSNISSVQTVALDSTQFWSMLVSSAVSVIFLAFMSIRKLQCCGSTIWCNKGANDTPTIPAKLPDGVDVQKFIDSYVHGIMPDQQIQDAVVVKGDERITRSAAKKVPILSKDDPPEH